MPHSMSQLIDFLSVYGEVKSANISEVNEVHVGYYNVQDAIVAHRYLQQHPGVESCKWASKSDFEVSIPDGAQPWQIWERLAIQYGDIESMAVLGGRVRVSFVNKEKSAMRVRVRSAMLMQQLMDEQTLLDRQQARRDGVHVTGLDPLCLSDERYQEKPSIMRSTRNSFHASVSTSSPSPGLLNQGTTSRQDIEDMLSTQYLKDFMQQQLHQQNPHRLSQKPQQPQQQKPERHQEQEQGNWQRNDLEFANIFEESPESRPGCAATSSSASLPQAVAEEDHYLFEDAGSGEGLDWNQFTINPHAIARGEDKRTTCMIRNIPNKYTQSDLIHTISEQCADIFYNFLYVPVNVRNRRNVGYAFINFEDPQDIIPFYHRFHGNIWANFNSNKVCAVAYARMQGLDALVNHFHTASQPERKAQPLFRVRTNMTRRDLPHPSTYFDNNTLFESTH